MALADYLIIGGGIAGVTAAETLRSYDGYSNIALLERGAHPLYSKVLIPRYLKGRIKREQLFLRTVHDYGSQKIGFYPNTSVAVLYPERREAHTAGGEIFYYKKLLVSAGGAPKKISWPGWNAKTPKILRMHTLEDADEIKSALVSESGETVVVMGNNFIALEFLEVFVLNGFTAHIIVKNEFFGETRFGKTGGNILENNFMRHKIIVHKKAEFASFGESGEVVLNNGEKIKNVKLFGAGIGLERDLKVFSSLDTGAGILTNEFLETSFGNVYAAGDIAEFYDVFCKERRIAGNWTSAFLQGRQSALNILQSGEKTAFAQVPSYNTVNLGFDIAYVGYLNGADDFWEFTGEKRSLDGKIMPVFARIFIKNGTLRGAVLINCFKMKPILVRIIEAGGPTNKNEIAKIF